MPLDQVKFLPRTKCGMDPASGADCSASWVHRESALDTESHLGTFEIRYCTRCKMGLTDPYPSEDTAGHLYDEKTSGDFDRIQHSPIDRIKDALARRLLKRIVGTDLAKTGRVLDYACGNARFAALAEELFIGTEVHAVDYQNTPPPLIAAGGHPRLSYLTVDEFETMTQKYDLIVLRHVLEHTHDPVRLVGILAARLAPAGILYIEVPNLESGCARVFKGKWRGYYVPRHIFHYTPESLRHIIAAAGLEGEIERNEMPTMGNMVAIYSGLKKENPFVQGIGVLLYPLQVIIETVARSSTCLNVKARRPSSGF